MKFFNIRAFLYALIVVTVLILLGIVSFNIVIDPFDRFHLINISNINEQKYYFTNHLRMSKPGALCRIQPTTIILGSSRAEIGLDPKHQGFAGENVYNFAMAGTGIGEIDKMLRHAVYASPKLHHVIIALDFLMFNAFREEVLFKTEVFDFDAKRLLAKPTDTCFKNFLYDANVLLGLNGLFFSFDTIQKQRNRLEKYNVKNIAEATWWAQYYDPDGFRGRNYDILNNLARNYNVKTFIKEDYYAQEDYYLKKIWRSGPTHRYCFVKKGQLNTLKVFSNTLDFARKQNLKIEFIINPIHARMLIALQEGGLWLQYEDWKRALVKTITENGIKTGKPPYPLWDFSGFNTITMEEPPKNEGTDISKWFWEPSHYRRETGDLIFDKIFNVKGKEMIIPKDFGMQLTPVNIEAWLSETLKLSKKYIISHKDEIKRYRSHFSPTLKSWTGSNCGDDIEMLRKGVEALQYDKKNLAQYLFKQAQIIHNKNKARAKKLGVPDRELGFETLLAKAKLGKAPPIPLSSWQAYQNRGEERLKINDLEGAIEDFTNALNDSPPNPALYFLRGQSKMKLENLKGAIEDFQEGLKIDPKNPDLKLLIVTVSRQALNKKEIK